ncbi:MAG TPA: carbohydrate porin, partial [Candidatus Didemnitutus sp.]|nr:carbohydrate porin [Candidatus Didemnitutus sp.]
PSGPIAHVQVTISAFNPYSDAVNSSTTDFGLPETWASIGNVVASQPTMKFWAGNRFYRRHDIHVTDFFFSNMSGGGGGIEDIALPAGKLALAYIGSGKTSGVSSVPVPDASNAAGFSKSNWDLRLYDVPMLGGKGEFGLVYAHTSSGVDAAGQSAPSADGVSAMFIHTTDGVFSPDGMNKASIQFGTGAAKTLNSGFETFSLNGSTYIRPDENDSWRLRVTEQLIANINDSFSVGPVLIYQLTDYAGAEGKVHWVSAGVRPIWHFNKYVSIAAEAGVDWVKDEKAGTSGSLYKITLAPQVSLGGRFMSRPAIRAFFTYATWTDDFVGQIGGLDYRTDNQGFTFGVQMEGWW